MLVTAALLLCAPLATDIPVPDAPIASPPPLFLARTFHPNTDHAFWDAPNLALFTGVTGARLFDYVSTHRFRAMHLKEWLLDDATVDNRPMFLAIELGGSAASVGFSYLMHRLGNHRAERWASILHIAFGVAGGIWNYTLPHHW